MRQLAVYVNDAKAGILTEKNPGKGYTFVYDDKYLASEGYGISVTMPKRKEPYESDSLFPLFTNMLPEGGNRRVICRSLKIDESDFFGLLTAMAGKDFIGATHVRPMKDERD